MRTSAAAAQPQAAAPRSGERQPQHTRSHVLRNALSSSLGAALVGTVVTPFDVVKNRVQAHVCNSRIAGAACSDPLHVDGALDALRQIVRRDGVRGLWRGLNATLLLAIPTTGLYFTLYEALRHELDARRAAAAAAAAVGDGGVPTALVAGATARCVAATAASPLELARTSMQAGVGGARASVLSVLRQVRRDSGLRAWWRGLGATLLRDAPFSAIYWSAYEYLKQPSRSLLPARVLDAHGAAVYVGAGVGAGALAAACTVPADVIKTRRQAQRGARARMSSLAIGAEILHTEGVRGMFRGAAPRVAKVAPACALMMASYEMLRTMLGAQQ